LVKPTSHDPRRHRQHLRLTAYTEPFETHPKLADTIAAQHQPDARGRQSAGNPREYSAAWSRAQAPARLRQTCVGPFTNIDSSGESGPKHRISVQTAGNFMDLDRMRLSPVRSAPYPHQRLVSYRGHRTRISAIFSFQFFLRTVSRIDRGRSAEAGLLCSSTKHPCTSQRLQHVLWTPSR
jgi:hypothetical protein